MKKFLLLIIMIGGFAFNAHSQKELSDYDYVVVPKLYDFLFEEDQHQLNSMTKFYFNKYGFNAYFEDELPNVTRCDGLRAEVEGKPGFIYTRITVVLKDCYGTELFRSEEGKSKFKEYKKSYQQALREAFKSIEVLGVQQKDLTIYTDLKEEKTDTTKTYPVINEFKRPDGDPVVTEAVTVATGAKITSSSGSSYLPNDKFTYYKSGNESYLLRKSEDGYSLYLESEESDSGLVLQGKIYRIGNALKFKTAENESRLIEFRENKDFTLVNGDDYQEFKYSDQ